MPAPTSGITRATSGTATGFVSTLLLTSVLFTMSTTTGLVLPLLLPHASYIAFTLLAISLVVGTGTGRRLRLQSGWMLPILVGLIALVAMFGTEQRVAASLAAQLQPAVMLVSLLCVLLMLNPEEFNRLLRIYVVFVVVMAVCGLIAWVLINWEFVDPNASLWSLFEATAGRASRDEGAGIGGTNFGYSFPYKLGLVLTASYRYDVFGLTFYRASGWAHEPTTAASLIAPAMILMLREPLFGKRTRRIFFVALLAFWFACAAVGSVVAFLGLIGFYLLFSTGRFVLARRVAAIVLAGIGLEIFRRAQALFATVSEYQSLLGSKLSSEGDISRLQHLISPQTPGEVVYLAMFLAMAGTLMWFGVRALRSGQHALATFALILVYFVLHSLKGDWGHVFASYFVMGFIFMFLRVRLSRWDLMRRGA